jgi:hypothetical protein
MSSTVPLKQQSPAWLKQLIKVSAVITAVGFIPWDSLLSLEIRDDTLAMLMDGTVGISGLFLLLCCLLIRVMQYDKWYSGLAMLLAPFVLMPLAFVRLFSLIGPAKWEDQTIFRNGNEYLILEGIYYGRDDMQMHYRLIRTGSLDGIIRHIQEQRTLTANNEEAYYRNEVVYADKRWHKQLVKK